MGVSGASWDSIGASRGQFAWHLGENKPNTEKASNQKHKMQKTRNRTTVWPGTVILGAFGASSRALRWPLDSLWGRVAALPGGSWSLLGHSWPGRANLFDPNVSEVKNIDFLLFSLRFGRSTLPRDPLGTPPRDPPAGSPRGRVGKRLPFRLQHGDILFDFDILRF